MGHFQFKELGSICNYAKEKYEERAETKRRRSRSSSDVTMEVGKVQPYGKLHKPPTVQSLHERPRKKLQKRSLPTLLNAPQPAPYLFVLEYDPYPYNTKPSEFLGVYATINSVTAGAFRYGAYTFSREGLLDGSEYLSPTGRIKILSHAVQSTGVTAAVTERSRKEDGELMRLDIPHPGQDPRVDSLQDVSTDKVQETMFLAIHEGPQSAFCIGLFTSKSLAWGACLKDKAWLAWSDKLVEEERSIGEKNMPQTSARLVGSGRHAWFVRAHEVDGKRR
ncbi:hypothetical protein BDW02DRAFT_567607 [Decorospora gaudefroyi]|uniref:Uncharacterized protein n=1 Tax=Decorospora gaudefroyi TaxID=184978 RepID=A0A6A5KFJ0_9PLEO|nr:hypothetical protein BDW02DRAFT_567607 [Decorospora gaudefroyi]